MKNIHWQTSEIEPVLSLTQLDDIRLVASKMHSHEKRSFMAEMTIKYCDGKSRKAESVFGWGRNIVETGLGEIRTGIICLGSQPACCGRKLWEEKEPQSAEALNSIADNTCFIQKFGSPIYVVIIEKNVFSLFSINILNSVFVW